MSKKHEFLRSFGYAGSGIKEAFKNEPNFRFHAIAALATLGAGLLLQFSELKFILLILTITLVITLELINTEIEKIVDFISPDYSEKAKVIKDISAATVLIAAFAAIAIGLLLFLPYILPLLSF